VEDKSVPIRIDKLPEIIDRLKVYIGDEFWSLLIAQGKNIRKEIHHPWARPYYQYVVKNKISPEVITMASEIFALIEFESYWANKNKIKQIIAKIKDPINVKSLMFEFRIGLHFKMGLRYDVELTSIPIDNNKIGDLLVKNEEEVVEIECTRKQDKPERNEYNLAKYLHTEARQFSGNHPGIIAIHIPEATDWNIIRGKGDLNSYVQEEFKKPIFRYINAVFYSCDQIPKYEFNPMNNRESFNTNLDLLIFENRHSIYKLPDWFQFS
jgi:hypothetical protein